MKFTWAIGIQSNLVLPGGISLILGPVVAREFVVELLHKIIPVSLGKNAGCGNGGIEPIALYHAFMGDLLKRGKAVAIDQQQLGLGIELFNGEVHAFKRSLQDVDLV